jgi:hypothetical protein
MGTFQNTYTDAMDLAQKIECLKTGTFLPNASGKGLSILPGTPRYAMDAKAIEDYTAQVEALKAIVPAADLAAAQAALATQLEVGNYSAGGGPGYANADDNAAAAALYPQWYLDNPN